jgi:hypothetical protein
MALGAVPVFGSSFNASVGIFSFVSSSTKSSSAQTSVSESYIFI